MLQYSLVPSSKAPNSNCSPSSSSFSSPPSSVSLEHNFRDWQDVDVFQSRVASMAYIGHGTYSAFAITNATQVCISLSSSALFGLSLADG